ncbi:WXG100 family type VII secretion target [Nocardia panacis]|uniref:WXG100 family type VII secretion target n=1 Tax=Nocardia panacis TaxID=2340916 RepID=UPI00131523D5|nr:WXG100 family type VII secretion target [Nocardia panacis]
MAGDYRVDLPGLQQLIDDAARLETTIEDLVTEIDKGIDQLHISWAGGAADAHRVAHDNRVAAIAEMRAALREMRAKLSAAHTAYTRVGSVNHGMWP